MNENDWRTLRLGAAVCVALVGVAVMVWTAGAIQDAAQGASSGARGLESPMAHTGWLVRELALGHLLAAGLGVAMPSVVWALLEGSQAGRRRPTWTGSDWDRKTATSAALVVALAVAFGLMARGAWIEAGVLADRGGVVDWSALRLWQWLESWPLATLGAMVLASPAATT